MTGWQGDEGNQGPWGPQGAQPYGGQPGGSYGQDPYHLQPDPYAYQTGGFPVQYPPPPPPPSSKLPMILGVLAIVLIVGAVVTIVLVNRDSSGSPTAAPTSSETQTRTESQPEPSEPTGSSEEPDTRDGWQTIDNTADSGLIYEVPPEWKVVPDQRPSGLGVDFTGTADYAAYQCEGATYVRGYATSGDVQGKDGADLDLAQTVKDFAGSFGKASFKDTAQVTVPEPEEFELDGRPAMRLAAKVTPQVASPACEATEGEVAIVGVLLEDDGEPTGVAMLVVVSDVAGGPADPKSLPKSVAREILASVRVG